MLNRSKNVFIIALSLVVLTAAHVGADDVVKSAITKGIKMSLAERKKIQEERESLNAHLPELNETCGSKITASIDAESFHGVDLGAFGLSSYCGEMVDGVRLVCKDSDAAKETVKEKIKTLKCVYGGVGKRALKVNTTSGEVTYTVDIKSEGNSTFIMNSILENPDL